jgi:hypothetical protein
VRLPGDGPLVVRLDALEGRVRRGELRVAVHEVRRPSDLELVAFALVLLAALAVEVVSARAHAWTPVTAAAAIAIGQGVYVGMRLDPDNPLVTAIAAVLVSIVAAGGLGLLLGLAAVFAVSKLGGESDGRSAPGARGDPQ